MGHSRSYRKGWTRSDSSRSGLGEAIPGRMVHGGSNHYGQIVSLRVPLGNRMGDGMTEKVVWHVVKLHAKKLQMPRLAPHDLRRSCARFCHAAGGELEQIQFLLGHVSVQTTERYLGCKQRFREAVNDKIGIEPSA